MRLKLTLKSSGIPSRDVAVTVDATATVGDVARYLVQADPRRKSASVGERATLRVEFPGSVEVRSLSPLLSVHESSLRSGCTVEVVSEDMEPSAPSRPVAVVRVIQGPDIGQEFTISAGVNYIGRDPAAQIRLSDKLVSRRHASITVSDSMTVTDLNSANGVELDGVLVSKAGVTGRSKLVIGDSHLQLTPLTVAGRHLPVYTSMGLEPSNEPDAHNSDAHEPSLFVRSPRIEPAYRGVAVPLPELPGVIDKARFPVLAVLSPVVMGAVLFAVTGQVITLLFIALSPIIMLGTWIDNRFQNKRKSRDGRVRFIESMEATRLSLAEEQEREVEARTAESPSVSGVIAAIQARSALVWTRKPEHTTFLEVRFGTGVQTSRNSVTLPGRNSASVEDWGEATELAAAFATVAGVPVIENLERSGAIGVAGTTSLAGDVARSIVVQLAGLHSPADLVVTGFGAGQAGEQWSWLKWLPHVDSAYSPLKVAGLAGDFASGALLLAELEEVIAVRRAAGLGKGDRVRSRLDEARSLDDEHGASVDTLPATPAILVVVTAESPADRARLVSVGEDGADVGVFLLWLAATVDALPVVCRTYVAVEAATGRVTAGFVRTGQMVDLNTVEQVDSIAAERAARVLAPMEDSGAQVLDESDLPRSVGFLDLFDGQVAGEQTAVVQRWVKNDSLTASWIAGNQREPGGIRALVGQGPIDPFFLDLRRHGPHALVGGTTGSGKSEFLQGWIMGLATEYSPDRVTFLLVDYKGGAAFAECVSLPHTVGLVTDLTPHLVHRALASLRAELKYREKLLNSKGAKDLETLERRSDPDAPPVLIIVIDEFAALASEVPEFVDGVIDVAQRGRSLGLHLIMATQRPSGVIKESLRANTNLRVALRVADENDSVDVLGVPSAAFFDPATPGRAAAKLGPGRVLDFQSAYLGGWSGGSTTVDIDVAELLFGVGAGWLPPAAPTDRRDAEPRDIERLAATITAAADGLRLPPQRRPWLDQLPAVHNLDDLDQASDEMLAIGILDEPEAQRQRPFELALDDLGNVAVFGTGGTGKSALLRTIAIAASKTAGTHPVNIYGLDFAGGGLASLETLPTVGSIIAGTDSERVGRLINELTALARERTDRFARANAATLTEYRALSGNRTEPRIIVLIDGMASFRGEFEFSHGGLFDDVGKLIAAGRQAGIHFVISADRLAAFPSALLANIQAKLVLRLAAESEYSILAVPEDVLADAAAGRALVGNHEVQISVPGGSSDLLAQAKATARLATALGAAGVVPVREVQRLPELVSASVLPASIDGRPVIGLSDETLEPVGIPLDGLFVVSGPFGSGRTTTMTTLIRSIRTARPDLAPHLLVARRSDLAGATDWAEASEDSTTAEDLATRLAIQVEGPPAGRDTNLLIVIENAGDFEGLTAEPAIARLIKAARRADVPVLVEADTVTAASAWQIFTELKTARAGIVLQPEETDGISLFRVQFPRVTRADFPLGRGLLVVAGHVSRVQVAFPDFELASR